MCAKLMADGMFFAGVDVCPTVIEALERRTVAKS
jgi:hypothetical protein